MARRKPYRFGVERGGDLLEACRRRFLKGAGNGEVAGRHEPHENRGATPNAEDEK
jgi:hypothetical protein